MADQIITGFLQEGNQQFEYVTTSWIDKFFNEHITMPIQNWWADKMDNLKYNSLDLIETIALVIIISVALKMFIRRKENDMSIIYWTIMGYTIARLYWKVVFHV